MPKVIPLSKLKINSTALIQDFTGKGKDNSFRYHLMALGFVPGRRVEIVRKTYSGFVTKIDADTNVAIGSSAAKTVMVNLLKDDVFEAAISNVKKESLCFKFLKLFTRNEAV